MGVILIVVLVKGVLILSIEHIFIGDWLFRGVILRIDLAAIGLVVY